ncbi:MAG: amino acid ABC transporter ATP-binding protein [Deltaproteobacteria bacterium]|nr:amino acid ABC transporter ATP-binding protein [Deltaproteobacteria bacterium]
MIAVDGLVKRYGEAEILKGIGFSVGKGEVDAIIGPSGGGKSTFIRCINGLERFQGGRVTVGEHTLLPTTDARRDRELLRTVRRKVGFVFQQFNLFPHLTVMQNLTEAPTLVLGESQDAARGRAATLLERVGLAAKHDALPRNLSGGQQQRVAIARTLMMQPEAILFDEPTSALDPVMANEVLRVMEDLATEGLTMIVVTHSMHFARHVADRVHVFAGGYDVETGTAEQVFEAPRHEVTRAFLGEARKS